MPFFKSTTPNTHATKTAEKSNRVGREDGQTNIVDVPQADGNSSVKPAETPAEKPVTTD